AIERLLHPAPAAGEIAIVVGLAAAAANWGVARLLRAPAQNNAAIHLAYVHNMGDAYGSLSPVVAGSCCGQRVLILLSLVPRRHCPLDHLVDSSGGTRLTCGVDLAREDRVWARRPRRRRNGVNSTLRALEWVTLAMGHLGSHPSWPSRQPQGSERLAMAGGGL